MNKRDFLKELENALDGKLSEADIREITSDYSDIFENGAGEGKSEDCIAEEIGSPAKIARTILEDGADGKREYTNFQKNINEKTSRILDQVIEPDRSVEFERLAPMPRRLGAYVIDSILLGVMAVLLFLVIFAPVFYSTMHMTSSEYRVDEPMMNGGMVGFDGLASGFAIGNMIMMVLLFGAFNLFTAIFLWATNGYTPGKWLLQMRVVKKNGKKLGFLDAFLRDVVIKCIANSVLSGVLNIISFIWGCATEDHKTVQDLVAQTRVVEVPKRKKADNPLEG